MITAYELACGCCERFCHGNAHGSIFREHNVYHVIGVNSRGIRGWYVFDRAEGGLKKARKAWTRMKQILRKDLPWPEFILEPNHEAVLRASKVAFSHYNAQEHRDTARRLQTC